MGKEQFIMMKLKDSCYSNQLPLIEDNIAYCGYKQIVKIIVVLYIFIRSH